MACKQPNDSRPEAGGTNFFQRIRVPLGFGFAVFYAWFAEPKPSWLWPGTLLAALGLLLRIWAAGHLQKHRRLCISGPYIWTRNPLYLGSFVMGVGFSVASASPWVFVVFAALFLSVYWPVMRREEEELSAAYGRKYEAYRNRVPLFFPGMHPGSPTSGRNFSLEQVILNREYNACLGFLTVFLFLLIKSKWQ